MKVILEMSCAHSLFLFQQILSYNYLQPDLLVEKEAKITKDNHQTCMYLINFLT